MKRDIHLPATLHPETADLVVNFAEALAKKLMVAQKKYGYQANWARDDWQNQCASDLLSHVRKGDPLDVAAYCAFMWYHKWPTSLTYTLVIHAENR